jgi:hypothetical protein
MKRTISTYCVAIAIALMLAAATPNANAGRVGGPMNTVGTAPAGLSVFYDVSLDTNGPTVITLTGNGAAYLHLLVYDSDGHVMTGNGGTDRRTLSIDVYRAGSFRIEVRNIGIRDNTFTLTTN